MKKLQKTQDIQETIYLRYRIKDIVISLCGAGGLTFLRFRKTQKR